MDTDKQKNLTRISGIHTNPTQNLFLGWFLQCLDLRAGEKRDLLYDPGSDGENIIRVNPC